MHSVKVLSEGQSQSGAFVASPNFASYRYSWLRDGAYCANAMDLVGNSASASKFHRWVEGAITRLTKYDLIIDASGASSRISEAIRQLVRGGTLLLLGFTGPDVSTLISIDDVVNGDLSILASFGYSRKAWELTVDFLNSGKLDLTFLVTHRFPLEKYGEAIEALRRAPSPRGKIIFEIGK